MKEYVKQIKEYLDKNYIPKKKLEDLEDIISNINLGVKAVEKHLDAFTEKEKEDYFYMINNIEVLINMLKKED